MYGTLSLGKRYEYSTSSFHTSCRRPDSSLGSYDEKLTKIIDKGFMEFFLNFVTYTIEEMKIKDILNMETIN